MCIRDSNIALLRFFAVASEVLHASLHSLDSQGHHHCVRTPAGSSSLHSTLATAHLTQRSNDIVLRDLVGTSRLGWSVQPIQTRLEHPTSFSFSRNTAPEFDLDASTSGHTAQSTLTQHYELEERKEQTNERHIDHIANLVLHSVASVAHQMGIHLTPLDSADLRLPFKYTFAR